MVKVRGVPHVVRPRVLTSLAAHARSVAFFIAVPSFIFTFRFFGFHGAKLLSLTVLASTVAATLLFWRFRLAFVIGGTALLLGTRLLDVDSMIHAMNLDVIVFLACMMIVAEFAENAGFTHWIAYQVLRICHMDIRRVVVGLLVLSAVFAALVDEVTTILFIYSVILAFCKAFDLDPKPLVIPTVFAINVGSTATVLGNPVGILLAMRAHLTFEDFIRWATPISVVCLGVVIGFTLLFYRKTYRDYQNHINALLKEGVILDYHQHVHDKREFFLGAFIFLGTIALIALHHRIELILGLEKNSFLIIAAMVGSFAILVSERDRARELVESGIDWWTLFFFMFLFACVETLTYTGVTKDIAAGFIATAKGDLLYTAILLSVTAAPFCALIDNVPAVATLIPVVHELGAQGMHIDPLWWVLLFSACLSGNATYIGSTANIVALGLMERHHEGIELREWVVPGVLVAALTILVAMALLMLQFPYMR